MANVDTAELERWGDLFVQRGYARYMTFLQFLQAPEKYAEQLDESRPLLPAQQAVAKRLDEMEHLREACAGLDCQLDQLERQVERFRCISNGRLYEPLKHHRADGRR